VKKTGAAESDDVIATMLRGAGLKRTASRVAVARVVVKAGRPMSHPEVVKALAGRGFDRATLYRNLVDLADAGLLRRSDHGDHVWRFEMVSRTKHVGQHPHFVCTDCGRVACLTDVAIEIIAGGGAPRAVRSRNVAVQLSGRCNACA